MSRKKESGSPLHSVLVTVEEQAQSALDKVAEALRDRGLKVVDILALGGVIAGEARSEDLAALRRVPGVESVEMDQTFTAD